MSDSIGITVVGTACLDDFITVGDLSGAYNQAGGGLDGKVVRTAPRFQQAGGSAINSRTAIKALDPDANVFICTKLGSDPQTFHLKERIIAEIDGHGLGDRSIIDGCYGNQGCPISFNTILLNGSDSFRGRLAIKDNEDHFAITNPTLMEEVDYALARSNLVCAHSRLYDLAIPVAKRARELGVPVFTDCSEKNREIVAHMPELLRNSDFVALPADALLPGMDRPDPELLFEMVKGYGVKYFFISDNCQPVRVCADGIESRVTITPVKAIDTLSAGDNRDGGANVALIHALSEYGPWSELSKSRNPFIRQQIRDAFIHAIEMGSAVASFSTTHYGRDWMKPEHLKPFMNEIGFWNAPNMKPVYEFSPASGRHVFSPIPA